MADSMEMRGAGGSWRIAMWGGAAALLAVPAVAMQFTREVDWGPEDFITMGAMLAAACSAFEVAVRLTRNSTARTLAGVAILAVFLTVWAELAVGILD
ncbi:hypothetical protein OF829_01200 [Sphingomonas sp. LB-2]|uniref:hypothetical protein n=1 Tax=Sphingomonas caeni TaxID=2984949 RepID=UPI002230DF7A|nr:hypothetical protein [Sphingomonas caeni]MCW3845839.1 hypothetical protein [Sphingomonas caeni]